MQLVEHLMRSTLIALLVWGNIVVLWLDQVETIALAVVPCNIGLTIDNKRLAAYGFDSKAGLVVEWLAENFVRGFVRNFDSMIHMVNHMRLKPNIVDSVDAIFVLVIFCSFHIVWNDIVILWENRVNSMIHPWSSFWLRDVDDELAFVQSCNSCCNRSGCRCYILDVWVSFLDIADDFDDDLGIAVAVFVLAPPHIGRQWLPFLQFLGPASV